MAGGFPWCPTRDPRCHAWPKVRDNSPNQEPQAKTTHGSTNVVGKLAAMSCARPVDFLPHGDRPSSEREGALECGERVSVILKLYHFQRNPEKPQVPAISVANVHDTCSGSAQNESAEPGAKIRNL